MRLSVSILVAVILTAVPASAVKKCDDEDSFMTVVGNVNPNTYKIEFTLENIGDEDVCVLALETLLGPNWPVALTMEVKDGNEWKIQTYDKPVLPIHLDISPSDYQYIKKNQQVPVTLDLSIYFSFVKNEQYQVRVRTIIQDCYKSDQPGVCNVASNAKDFVVPYCIDRDVTKPFTAGATKSGAKVTIEQWLETIDDKPHKKDGTVITFGADQNELEAIKDAHNLAWQYFKKAVELLDDVPGEVKDGGEKLDIYKTWFGSYEESNYNKVLATFQACLGEKDKFHVYVVLPSKLCKENDLAYVLELLSGKKQHFINVCPGFFHADESYEEVKVLTLIHEMTHDTANTEDLCNPTKDACKAMAIENPHHAIRNAENYARFAAAAYDLSLGIK